MPELLLLLLLLLLVGVFIFIIIFFFIHTRALNPSWALADALFDFVAAFLYVGWVLSLSGSFLLSLPVSSIYSLAIDRMKPRGVLLEQGGRVC